MKNCNTGPPAGTLFFDVNENDPREKSDSWSSAFILEFMEGRVVWKFASAFSSSSSSSSSADDDAPKSTTYDSWRTKFWEIRWPKLHHAQSCSWICHHHEVVIIVNNILIIIWCHIFNWSQDSVSALFSAFPITATATLLNPTWSPEPYHNIVNNIVMSSTTWWWWWWWPDTQLNMMLGHILSSHQLASVKSANAMADQYFMGGILITDVLKMDHILFFLVAC